MEGGWSPHYEEILGHQLLAEPPINSAFTRQPTVPPSAAHVREMSGSSQLRPPSPAAYLDATHAAQSSYSTPESASFQVAQQIDFSHVDDTGSDASSSATPPSVARAGTRANEQDWGDPRPLVTYRITGRIKKSYWNFILAAPKDEYMHVEKARLSSEHAGSAYCVPCRKRLSYTKGHTAAIARHVGNHHKGEVFDLAAPAPAKPPLLNPIQDGHDNRPYKKRLVAITKMQQDTLNELTALWLAGDQRPYSLVNDAGYRKIITYVASLGDITVNVSSRTKVTEDVKALASRMRETLKTRIRADCEHYSITTDIWSDRGMRSYISLTLHYVEEDFTMNSWTLEVEGFPGKHTGAAISASLDAALRRWNLSKTRCVRLVRDGAANAKLAAELLGVPHESCMAHSVHLVVSGAMAKHKGKTTAPEIIAALMEEEIQQPRGGESEDNPEVEEAMDMLREEACNEVDQAIAEMSTRHDDLRLSRTEQDGLASMRSTVQVFRNLAVYFNKSAKGNNRLAKIRLDKNPDVDCGLSVDCPTRWNSCYDMLDRILKQKETMEEFFLHIHRTTEFKGVKFTVPKKAQWAAIRCLYILLEPFAASLTELGGDGYPTITHVVPCLRYIKRQLTNTNLFDEEKLAWSHEDFAERLSAEVDALQRAFLKIFVKRFRRISDEVLWVSYLDPRLSSMQHLTPVEVQQARHCVMEAMIEVAQQRARLREQRTSVSATEGRRPASTPKKAYERMIAGIYGARASGDPATTTSTVGGGNNATREIQRACSEEFMNYLHAASSVTVQENPLKWWRAHAATFPVLAAVARKWLSCVATSVPAERAFSTGGNIVTAKRCSLTPANVRDTVFISENLEREERRWKDMQKRERERQKK